MQARFFDSVVAPTIPANLLKMDVFRRRLFPEDGGPLPWLDAPNASEVITARKRSGQLSAVEAEWCRSWSEDGFIVLESFYSPEAIDTAWVEYERSINDGHVSPPFEPLYEGDVRPGRVLNPHFSIPALDGMLFDAKINYVISVLLGAKSKPFQTIVGHKGSQQLEHSDSIHMTTYPQGYLAATWVACEDIHPDSGPLVYYPGSHKLPYVLSEDLDMRAGVGYADYGTVYEPAIQSIISENELIAKFFTAKKGDVLIWHANLLHGGSKVKEPRLSRKALVCHYFAEGCICYHDVSGGLSRYAFGDEPYSFPEEFQRIEGTIRSVIPVQTGDLDWTRPSRLRKALGFLGIR